MTLRSLSQYAKVRERPRHRLTATQKSYVWDILGMNIRRHLIAKRDNELLDACKHMFEIDNEKMEVFKLNPNDLKPICKSGQRY
jgi:hypothetical protein